VAKVDEFMALAVALEAQFAAGRAISANVLAALVAEHTGASAARPGAKGAPLSQPGAPPGD
jgi:hypothetical protein